MANNGEIIGVGEGGSLLIAGYVSKDQTEDSVPAKTDFKELVDIAQSHHFTVTIDKIGVNYDSGLGNSDKFLPVQNISFSYTSFNNMDIPVGIYGDLPLLKRKSVCRISLSLYDNDKDEIETAIKAWENSCFPSGMYVNYLSDIVGRLTYKSYNVKGKLNKTVTVSVIPADNMAVNRGYSDNAPKIINLSLVAVGPVSVK